MENATPVAKGPFVVKDCDLITQATGIRASNLKEFRDGLSRAPVESVYHHFWGRLMRPQFDEPEYNNDFASWTMRGLNDKVLAERLSMVVPSDFEDLEDLRREILEVLDQRSSDSDLLPWAGGEQKFFFLQSQIVIFDTGLTFDHPLDMASYLPSFSTGSIFFHFIDARGRTEHRRDDFSLWLRGFGEEFRPLARMLTGIDPYFSSLKEIRKLVTQTFQHYFEERP